MAKSKEEHERLPQIDEYDALIDKRTDTAVKSNEKATGIIPQEIRDQAAAILEEANAKVSELFAPYAQEMLAVQLETAEELKELDAQIAQVKTVIDRLVIARGHTMVGSKTMVVYVGGKTSVNVDKLKGYAAAHPEVKDFITYGDPSVAYRKIT